MKATSMKIWTTLLIAVVLSMGLLVLNGCKKSEPEPAAPAAKTAAPAAKTAAPAAEETASEAVETIEQTTCPVMGGAIDKALFTEYKGKKVYFCCDGCKEKFLEKPEQYIAKLPQFKN